MPEPSLSSPFYQALRQALAQRGRSVSSICPNDDDVARRVLHDYGAMFVGARNILPPPLCVFINEDQVLQFQEAAGREAAMIGEAIVELQPAAVQALLRARVTARGAGLGITPREGAEGAR